ncbi:hypothetical protein SteCoe_13581 [Stentor coeruleus]|uniref:Uncharacterized protein n=1 Tax=Stentor coeruleus TaxID=5963 RepID=A0A1R2C859_9CILI|nr:hypothetical protein SteCoe_13581 [Stentor coeruleus]
MSLICSFENCEYFAEFECDCLPPRKFCSNHFLDHSDESQCIGQNIKPLITSKILSIQKAQDILSQTEIELVNLTDLMTLIINRFFTESLSAIRTCKSLVMTSYLTQADPEELVSLYNINPYSSRKIDSFLELTRVFLNPFDFPSLYNSTHSELEEKITNSRFRLEELSKKVQELTEENNKLQEEIEDMMKSTGEIKKTLENPEQFIRSSGIFQKVVEDYKETEEKWKQAQITIEKTEVKVQEKINEIENLQVKAHEEAKNSIKTIKKQNKIFNNIALNRKLADMEKLGISFDFDPKWVEEIRKSWDGNYVFVCNIHLDCKS